VAAMNAKETKVDRPETLTDFRQIGKKRMGISPTEAKAKHDDRRDKRDWLELQQRPAVTGRILTMAGGCYSRRWQCKIPLGGHDIAIRVYKRAKNRHLHCWRESEPGYRSEENKIDNGNYSRKCTFTHYTYERIVESWGRVVGGKLTARIDMTDDGVQVIRLQPWRGWHWELDNEGIKIVDAQGRRDYHPTAHDLLRMEMPELARLARENHLKRVAETKRQAKSKAAQRRELAAIKHAERVEVLLINW